MAEWRTVTLEELVYDGQISYGVVQPGRQDGSGVPLVRVKDIRNGLIDTTDPVRVNRAVAGRHTRTLLAGGEVLVTLVGTVGEAAVVEPHLAGWNVARAVAVIRPDGVSAKWLRIAFQTPEVRRQIHSAVNTTVQTTLNLSDLKRLRIPLPDEQTRSAIVEVLGALDDKIVANSRLVRVAEGLAVASAAVVPASRAIGELAKPARTTVSPDQIADAVVDLFSLPGFDAGAIPERVAPATIKSGKLAIERPSVLISKLNPRIPRIWDVPTVGPVPALASTEFVVLQPETVPTAVLWALLMQPAVREALQAQVAGTSGSHQRVKLADVLRTAIGDPRDLGGDAVQEISAAVARSHAARAESTHLAAIRDALLPALMSGRLRVQEAEKLAENLT